MTDDLEAHGLVDFSLRRAARAAGTTHKVLLYYFDGVDDLMRHALLELRHRRIDVALAEAGKIVAGQTLSARIRVVWQALIQREGALRVLDQASGLAMYDPDRYADLGRQATEQYLPPLIALCPQKWERARQEATAGLILAALRGLLLDFVTSDDQRRVNATLETLLKTLDQQEMET